MSKYKGQHMLNLDADDSTYSEQLTAEQQAAKDAEEAEKAKAAEGPGKQESTFEKRYGDLRRYMNQTLETKDAEIAKLKRENSELATGQVQLPATDEEIGEWVQKFPEVAKIVESIARKNANEAVKASDTRLQELEERTHKLTKREAYLELCKLHSDFPKISQDPEFREWAKVQPTWVYDALFSDEHATDYYSASRAVDLYKADKGIGQKVEEDPKPKDDTSLSAAMDVGKASGSTPDPQSGDFKFKESQVDAMTPQEYEENEEAITKAIRAGKFEYDITGAAQ